ncbi:MAG: hypothetical protein D6748_10820 [Calditrichaeota bacterium]|nr:MAG: hypothetical protein D6748_10820 [Calditrichota bacterium]
MQIKQQLMIGLKAGFVMGISLFITGAIAAYIFYGPAMAPAGKFEADQMNPLYFIWTKLAIGIVFGIFFVVLYERLPLHHRIKGIADGVKYASVLWLAISLWNLSHPFVYEFHKTNWYNELFWHIYTLGGFLGYGITVGYLYRKVVSDLT